MHRVSRLNEITWQTPELYVSRSTGFRRATYVDYRTGGVHMGVSICRLEPEGVIEPHIHSFEESIYILMGEVVADIGEKAYRLHPGHFGLIGTGVRHAWRNATDQPVRWLEMQAPQPRPAEYARDTFFPGGDVATTAAAPDPSDPAQRFLGYFDESQLPHPGGPSQMEGLNPTTGIAIRMFVDRSIGAIHQSLFLIQYWPGAKIDPHDHTFEEFYLIVSGQVRATADGHTYDMGPGDVIWTSVGCIHSFANLGQEPVRWIETQAPLPPSKEVFRFERDWKHLA